MMSGRCCAINVDGGGGGGGGISSLIRGGQSWIADAQSISTPSSAAGSAGNRSEKVVVTKKGNNGAFARINRLDVQDQGSPSNLSGRKKRGGARAAAGDKSGRGLRQFSMKVCEKVESKGRTTYNEVADELVAEFANPGHIASPGQQQFDEKNIRRRVYDALNVLMAMDIISKDKKEIQWKGLPHASSSDIEDLKAEHTALRSRIEKKAAHLQELEEQFIGLRNLIRRNKQSPSTSWLALPFILVQTREHAHVEVEISGDMQLVYFDFNSIPFELHDDAYVLKAMGLCGGPCNITAYEVATANGGEATNMPGIYQCPSSLPSRSNVSNGPTSSSPVPGILKGHAKHEQHL
ncbi:unnamed protein product [Victoria cruziana]